MHGQGTYKWEEGQWKGDSYVGKGEGTFTSSKGWVFTGTLKDDRPTAGVLTEADGRRYDVKYAADCPLIVNNPTPSSKVLEAERKVPGALHPPVPPALCSMPSNPYPRDP